MRVIRRAGVAIGLAIAVAGGSALAAAPAQAAAAKTAQAAEAKTALAATGRPESHPAVTAGWRIRMLAEVNAAREAAGVPAVILCPRLSRVAGARARSMAATDSFGHIDRRGADPGDRISAGGYRWSLAGENIAANQRRVHAVMADWLDSPTHLATLTEARFTHVGFGHALDPGGPRRTLWVQDFGAGGRCS